MSASAAAVSFRAFLTARVGALYTGFGWSPQALPASFASRRGTWRGTPVTITASAFAGDRLRYGRLVTVSGGDVEIANLLCLPDPRFEVPSLGVDLVRIRTDQVVVVADLVPERPPHADARAVALPRWAEEFFSADPFIYRGPAGGAEIALAEVERRIASFAAQLRTARPLDRDRAARQTWQDAYCHAHRRDDRALGMLERMFGGAWAADFIADVMFPVTTVDLGELALARLRAATRRAHLAVEALVPILEDDVTLGDYVRFLAATAAAVVPLEARIAERGLPAEWGVAGDHPRAAWLAADLAALARRMPPQRSGVPPLETMAHAAGAAYVLEGSSLGGQVLMRHLRSRLGVPDAASHYLRSDGQDVSRRWRTFRTGLGEFLMSSGERERDAIDGARAAFAFVHTAYAGLKQV